MIRASKRAGPAHLLAPPAADALEDVPCALSERSRRDVVYHGLPDRGVPSRFDVVRCHGCGLVRTRPRPTHAAIRAYYPDSYSFYTAEERQRGVAYSVLRSAIRLPYRLRYGDVDPKLPQPGQNRLLDVGSGAGHFLAHMSALGWEPWGIEPNAALARGTVQRLGLPEERVLAGTAEEADFQDGTFDLVTMSHVLEHVHNPRDTLADVARWLAPHGRVRIWLPNYGSLESRAFRHLWQGLDIPRHLYHFTPATLRATLTAAGFEVERMIPQWQGNMLTGSLAYAFAALRGRERAYRESRRLHVAVLPAAAALLALGQGGRLDVTARRRPDAALG